MTLLQILFVYLAFRAKQLVCDFFLQTGWMASTKAEPFNMGGAKALTVHAGIHAAFTFVLVMLFAPQLWWLGIVDFVIHAGVDKLKGVVTKKFGWTYKDSAYWWAFGTDQEMHNLTHLGYLIAIALSNGVHLS